MLSEKQVSALTFGLFPYIPLAINLTTYIAHYVLCSSSLTDFETMVLSKYRDQNRKGSC